MFHVENGQRSEAFSVDNFLRALVLLARARRHAGDALLDAKSVDALVARLNQLAPIPLRYGIMFADAIPF